MIIGCNAVPGRGTWRYGRLPDVRQQEVSASGRSAAQTAGASVPHDERTHSIRRRRRRRFQRLHGIANNSSSLYTVLFVCFGLNSQDETVTNACITQSLRSLRSGPYGQCVRSPPNRGCFFFAGIAEMLILRMLKTI